MRACCLAVLVVGLFTTLPAIADVPPESADALFVRARSLMKTGDCVAALPLLEQSHTLEPTLGTRFNMAICESRLGKLTQAAEHLRSVVDGSAPDDERRAHAERALKDLLPRIPRLVLELDAQHELKAVRLDGQALVDLRANEPFAFDPGPHELEVSVSGEPPQVRRFSAAERQLYTWSLGTTRDAPRVEGTKDQPGNSDSEQQDQPFVWTTRRTAAVIAGGASVAAFGVATGFALSARSIYDSSDPDCPQGDVCEPAGIEKRDQARVHGRIATVALTVGIASAISAGTLWLTGAPPTPERSRRARASVRISGWAERTTGGGILLEGSY